MNYEYCNGRTHTIKKGDTLYALSRRYQVPLEMLLRANPYVDVYNLQVGDTLCIPVRGQEGCRCMPPSFQNGMGARTTNGADGMMQMPEVQRMSQGRMSDDNMTPQRQMSGDNMTSENRMSDNGMTPQRQMSDDNMVSEGQMSEMREQKTGLPERLDTTIEVPVREMGIEEQHTSNAPETMNRVGNKQRTCRIVTEQGDTMQSLLDKAEVSLEGFLAGNTWDDVALLPGVAYRVSCSD